VGCLSDKETDVYDAILGSIEKLKEIAHNIAGNKTAGDDAFQELMVSLFEKEDNKLKAIYDRGDLLWYCIRALTLMLKSSTSRYYYKYKKYYTLINGNITADQIADIVYNGQTSTWKQLDKIDKIIDEIYWYDREIFKLYYYQPNTLHGLAEQTGISRTSIFKTIKRVKKYIKKRLEEERINEEG
jgi:RNA polymerase sigma factor (sigma-70 family)